MVRSHVCPLLSLGMLLVLFTVLLAAPPVHAAPEGEGASSDPVRPLPAPGRVEVPDVRRLRPRDAAWKLVRAGLNVGRIFEVEVPAHWKVDFVVQQAPPPSTREAVRWLPMGSCVALRIAARQAGPTEGRPPPGDWPRVAVPAPVERPAPPPLPSPPSWPVERDPAPRPARGAAPSAVPPPPPTEGPGEPPASPAPFRSEGDAPSVPVGDPVAHGREEVPPARIATGSPDVPAPAPPADPQIVPALLGLAVADAEHLVHEAEMALHVEWVAGHPVGRVFRQEPEAGAPRPPGGVIKVQVTAGGDHLAVLAPPPAVDVVEIAVPDLLDRTEPQARRILEAFGFEARVEPAPHGPAGRVADQKPGAGTVLAKGSTVLVRVAPARVAPATGEAASLPGRSSADAADPTSPQDAGPVVGPPLPLAPARGTAMGPDRALAVGFTWRAAVGADAYLVEVEERGPGGWVPNARRIARTSAVVLEIERVAPTPGPLRWRVRAVSKGRPGSASEWVVLR